MMGKSLFGTSVSPFGLDKIAKKMSSKVAIIILTRRTAFLGKTECPENLGAFTLSYLEPIRYRLPLVGGVSQFFVVN